MEFIILQPLQTNNANLNTSLIERKSQLTQDEENLILHEAGGPFSGFIVKKIQPLDFQQFSDKSDLSFKLNVYMKHTVLPGMQQEQRIFHFWFSTLAEKERITCSNSFFHNIFKGDNFPKDYFMFLLKVMQIFKALKPIKKLKIEILKIGDAQQLGLEIGAKNPKQFADIVTGKILEFLERAFPNSLSVDELARLTNTQPDIIGEFLRDLYSRGLVKYLDNGANWIRNIVNFQDETTHEIIMIQQQPTVSNDQQPTIAVITVNYYEKLAVDAMMSNKVTFVRHKPEGESNVYTIGNIGEHRVVSTKLPLFGRDSRSAKISSGNTTTRLLGIFQKVEHVFLVGCAGGVPHYSDYNKHPRRGDIIVSFPDPSSNEETEFVYGHFEVQKSQANSQIVFNSWMPTSTDLYKIVNAIKKTYNPSVENTYPWDEYLEEGIRSLNNEELDCRRPVEDKLFFNLGDKKIVEVNHPENANGGLDRRHFGKPELKFGKIGGGETIVRDDNLRHLISEQYGILCFDSDMDQVMESIEGNRKDSFIIIRSIVDYIDGSTSKEWHAYSSLCAAAFAKTIICALPSEKQ